ncbi:MAG: flagellar basal body-associated FliL family protein [Candidatus Krumholzibacteriota bacterium]|nr:flagellar basal body-associated FliL family protein [Candidatus Krumholzibacteriota bacterium]
MADNQEEKTEEKSSPRKSFLSNPLVLIGIILVVQIAIAFVLGKIMSSRAIAAYDKARAEAGSGELSPAANDDLGEGGNRGTIVMLDNIIVNLKERDKLYYLKVTIGLEVPDSSVQNEIKQREAQLKDDVISLLSGKRVSELDSLEERNALKAELHKRISASLLAGDLINIYFSDFVIQ